MRKATSSPYSSDYGFKSPGFTVDAQGNIIANSITLSTNQEDTLIGDYEFTDNGIGFNVVGIVGSNPTIELARGRSYTLELSLTNFDFEILKSDQTTYIDFTINHSDGSTGNDAQGKSSGLLTFTIPQTYDSDEIYYKAAGTSVVGSFSIVNPLGLFSRATITDLTDSNTPESGALLVSGGIGVNKNVTIGGELNVTNISAYNEKITLTASDSSIIGIIDSSGSTIPVVNTTITNSTASFTSASILESPTESNDITNKTYVDSTVSALAIALGT